MSNATKKQTIENLLETLRNAANSKEIGEKLIIIPSNCEKNGFVKGEYKLNDFLYFIADMLEE